MTAAQARKSAGARRSEASSEAILAAASKVLQEKGHAGFSIEAVAREARAGKPTIYRWWPSKAALLLDVYQRQKRDVVCPQAGPLEADLLAFLNSLFRQWRETATGEIFKSIVAEAQSNAEAAQALADYAASRRANTGRIVESAIQRGEIRTGVDATIVADLVASYAWVHLLTNRLDEDETRMKAAIDYIVRGVAKPPRT